MDMQISSVITTLFLSLIVSIVTALITVRLSINQFKSQRWWDEKVKAYASLLESLFYIKHNLHLSILSEEIGHPIANKTKADFVEKVNKGFDEFNKVEGIGSFIISEDVSTTLTKFKKTWEGYFFIHKSHKEILDNQYSEINSCIEEVKKYAKIDLKI